MMSISGCKPFERKLNGMSMLSTVPLPNTTYYSLNLSVLPLL